MTLDELFRAHYDAGFPDRDDEFWSAVEATLFRCLRSHVPANSLEDAVQEVCVLVVRKRKKLRREGSFTSWLLKVGPRYARQKRRNLIIGTHEPLPSSVAPGPLTGLLTRLSRAQQREELSQAVNEALERIKTALRRTVRLKLDGLTNAEIARREGISEQTVRVRLFRARRDRAFRRVVALLNEGA